MDRGYFALQISSLHVHVLPGLQLWFLCLFIIMHIHYSISLILFRGECDLVHGIGSPGSAECLGGNRCCKLNTIFSFDVLLTVHLSIILAVSQLNAQNILL